MKLLTIIETLGVGGAEQVLVALLPELQKNGVECHVLTLFEEDDLASKLIEKGVKVHKLNISKRWSIFEGMYKLSKFLNKNQFDIVHAHLYLSTIYLGLVSPFFKNIKKAVTFHNLTYNVYPATTLWRKLRRKLESKLVNNMFDLKIADSQAIANHYMENLNTNGIKVINISFPLSKMKPSENKISLDKFFDGKTYKRTALTIGRLVIEKGHIYLLEAIEKLNRDDICFLIIGKGPLEEEIKAEITKRNLTNVKLILGLDHQELMDVLNSVDYSIVSSTSEGFPLVVGEAMAYGKPIIATSVGGIPEMIENKESGIVVPSKDSVALKNAIEELLNDDSLKEKIASNALKEVKKLDVDYIVQVWISEYKNLLGN